VIIAEGQSGKSEEFRQQAASLHAAEKFAFYCPLESLLHLPLASALELGTSADLAKWFASDSSAWFFFDAVDEAKIESPRHFEQAIAKAVAAIESSLSRAHILISTRRSALSCDPLRLEVPEPVCARIRSAGSCVSRVWTCGHWLLERAEHPNAWDAISDQAMLSRRLGLRTTQETRRQIDAQETETEADTLETGDAFSEETEKTSSAPILSLGVFKLAPLTRPQVQEFARAQGVPDTSLQHHSRMNGGYP
jgi:hypothetical protein